VRQSWLRALPFLLVPIFLLGWVYWQDKVPMHFYMEDPAALAKLPVGTSMVATIGITLWFANGFLAAFAAQFATSKRRRSLLYLAVLCVWLGLDDMLLLHEDVIPDLFGDAKPIRMAAEIGLFAFYGLYLSSWIFLNRGFFSKIHWSFLIATLALFASSIGLDLARGFHLFDPWSRMERDMDYAIFWEDAPKVMGLFTWATFIWHYSLSAIDSPRTSAN